MSASALNQLTYRILDCLCTAHPNPVSLGTIVLDLKSTVDQVDAALDPLGPLGEWIKLCPSGRGFVIEDAHVGRVQSLVGTWRKSSPLSNPLLKLLESQEPTVPPALYLWQHVALSKWIASERRGIVEAVTGSGKTNVALAAMKDVVSLHKSTSILVVVPTIALMEQWRERLGQWFPNRFVGQVGAGCNDTFASMPVGLIAVINGLARNFAQKLEHLLGHTRKGVYRSFLVADECHRYIHAPVFNRLLQFPFTFTLGLTATLPKGDPDQVDFEVEGLGKIVTEYTFQDAHHDGLVPSFDLVNVGVSLTPMEWEHYEQVQEKLSDQWKLVMQQYGEDVAGLSDITFFRYLQGLAGKIGDIDGYPIVQKLLLLFYRRAAIHYKAENKMRLAEEAARRFLKAGKKVIAYFERIASAAWVDEKIALAAAMQFHQRMSSANCWLYHSQMPKQDRARALAAFRAAPSGLLLACRSLDEGLDVPDVDAAILAASTQTRRQRIQRIGRTLRKGDGGKRPIILTLTADGTSDDRVTERDAQDFGGVATIHTPSASNALHQLDRLLAK